MLVHLPRHNVTSLFGGEVDQHGSRSDQGWAGEGAFGKGTAPESSLSTEAL